MEFSAGLVAVVFGVLMAWASLRSVTDPRPFLTAVVLGTAAGLVVLVGSLGDDPGLVGGSLSLGCGSATLATIVLAPGSRLRGRTADPTP